jgi:hypothetical protein
VLRELYTLEGYMPRELCALRGYMPTLRLYTARETLVAERLRVVNLKAKLRVNLRVVKYT